MTAQVIRPGSLVMSEFTDPLKLGRDRVIYGEVLGIGRAGVSVLWEDGSIGVIGWDRSEKFHIGHLVVMEAPRVRASVE